MLFGIISKKLGILINLFVLFNCFLKQGYGAPISYPAYTVMAGTRVELPCDLNGTLSDDDVSLILWHRDDSGSPLYSLDARDSSLSSARHFPSQSLSSRAYFNASSNPTLLRIEGVRKNEEGAYRCRVEYKRSRTETTDLVLSVIVPPKEAIIMDEFGQHLQGVIGPYNEGFPLALACEGEGGDPSPSVRWWRDEELLDDSYHVTLQGFARNELLLPDLKRNDLLMRLTCQVSNSNLTAPVTSYVVIDMNLKPTEVDITSMYQPLSVDRPTELVCVARGARPPAQTSWWLNGEKLTSRISESSARDENLTVSSLVLIPTRHDHQKNLSCRGDNPQVPDSVLEDTWTLDVHFPPKLTVKADKQLPVLEGSDVSLTCLVWANPPIAELEWVRDGQSQGPPARKDTKNRTLTIPSVSPTHKGRYQCAAVNSEGRTISNPLIMKVKYAPRCRSVRSSVYGVGRTESVSVSCEVDANPSAVTFAWSLDGNKVLKSHQYISNGTRSIATISPRSPQDYGLLLCWASNAVGRQREPCTFRIVPAGPPEEPRNCFVSNRTETCLFLECEVGEDGGLQQLFQLEVFSTDSDKVIANISAHATPIFRVCSLPPTDTLVLVVYAVNNKGRSREIALHLPGEKNSEGDDSGILVAVLGVLAGIISVLICSALFMFIAVKCKRKRFQKERTCKDKSDQFKECKEPCMSSKQGPDIIPEKRLFFQERTDSLPEIIEVDQGVNPSSAQSDPSSRKYRLAYPDEYTGKMCVPPEESTTTIALQSTTETPLISSINPILQEWKNNPSETTTLRLSTQV